MAVKFFSTTNSINFRSNSITTFCSNLQRKSRDAHGKQESSEADEALPEEEELVVLLVVEVLMNGVSGMLMGGMVDGVMEGRTGDDKSKDTAEGPRMENEV